MVNDITKSQSFEEKMKDRIRESIGELITDEELSQLVHRSIDAVFFKAETDVYGKVIKPALLNELTKQLLAPSVKECIQQYIAKNHEEVKNAINEVISGGIASAFVRAFDNILNNAMYSLQQNIETAISSLKQY